MARAFLSSLSTAELQHYHEVVTRSTAIRSHFDLLTWLQGDMQRYLPHEILIASWGAFSTGELLFDVISPLPGVRSRNLDSAAMAVIVKALHQRWAQFGAKPFSVESGCDGFPASSTANSAPISLALGSMRSALVHGILDSRGGHDCLYVAFNSMHPFRERERAALSVMLPYIDTALRRLQQLPQQKGEIGNTSAAAQHESAEAVASRPIMLRDSLSDRESQILHWVALGKTNPEIASILQISSFTVKNHMQRVFKKLDVTNRAQAVGKVRPMARAHVEG